MMSCKIIPYVDHKQVVGVTFPGCSRVLTSSDVDEKIEKMISHKEHLMGQLAHKDTHGGKRHRVTQIELKTQIDAASKRLTLLELARDMIEVKVDATKVAAGTFSLMKDARIGVHAPLRYACGPHRTAHYENVIFVVRRDIREKTEIRGLLIRTCIVFQEFRRIMTEQFPKIRIIYLQPGDYRSVDGVVVDFSESYWNSYSVTKLRNGTICLDRVPSAQMVLLIRKAQDAGLVVGAINSTLPVLRSSVFAL